VIIPEVVNDFFGRVINGIESIAQEKHYHVLIYQTHEIIQKEVSITRLLQNGRVDGIMISPSELNLDTTHLEELKQKEIPLVFFDRMAENIVVPKVFTDDYNSSFNATEHLVKNGCKRIAYLSNSLNNATCNRRFKGYQEALIKYNIQPDNGLIISCNENDAGNKDLVRKLLKSKNKPDGIFASVEKLAIMTYKLCGELKLNIPNDIKIITFSTSYMADLLNPSLTTITQPAFEIGREAAAILFKLIEKRGGHFILEKTELNSILIERNSTKQKTYR
jgi:LacI family transcriptional regulator